jgi:transketolase
MEQGRVEAVAGAANDRIAQLKERAARLREHSLRATTKAGSGHPSSCLSAADLVAALFFHVLRYDPRDPGNRECDQFILSKGHAAPLLYAAWAEAGAFPADRLLTLRSIESDLEGHPTPRFAGTVAATGSLGQGLSIGVGMAWNAKRLEGNDQRIYVLLGDGEMAEGSVWEAVALAAHNRLDNLVAMVDVNALGQSQRTMYGFDTDSYVRRLQSFGWEAIAIDGHDMGAILEAFERAGSSNDRPFAIVARTAKGQGVSFLADHDNWHGKPLNPEQLSEALRELAAGRTSVEPPPVVARRSPRSDRQRATSATLPAPGYAKGDMVATREAYGAALARLGAVDARIVAIDGDTKNSTYAELFLKAHPERYLEGFIAEQNMIGAGVGLAAGGRVPFVSSFACFLTRGFDHIRMAAISRANLKLVGSHCGVSIGEDGPSQMGLEDIAMMRAIPDAVVLYPADAVCTERLVEAMAAEKGIHYLRLTRPKVPVLYDKDESFPVGGVKVLRSGPDDVMTVIAAGITLFEALEAHERLRAQRTCIRVLDAYSIRPLDAGAIVAAARATGNRILTVEDHYADGGLGDAVLNAVAGEGVAVSKLAVRQVPRSGAPRQLLHAFGIDADAIAAEVRRILGQR